MHIPFTTLDVFTPTRYLGNPLAIIRPPTPTSLSQTQKLQIAKEFNLSEVVFLHLPQEESLDSNSNPKELKIDIFTADAEIPFAGHPTIGTAFFVRNYLGLKSVEALITKAGRIPISFPNDGNRNGSDNGKIATAQIPHDIHVHAKTYSFKDFTTGEETQCPIVSIVNGMSFILVHLPSLEHLERAPEIGNLNPDSYHVQNLDEGWRNGLCSTMYFVGLGNEKGRCMYRTRMFATAEDPGTGSASCALACWLSVREEGDGKGNVDGDGGMEKKFGFVQGVEMGRRNDIFVNVRMTRDGVTVEEVVLSGEAVKVMEGILEV
ncbi:hypothetical protein OCU04_007853 [Sclerotinia nivalis]|uniref:Phenazine biosynthesis-like protein n=1 Tax=Sclerotinia nivalis TaxID=352851 RepID=A0A9X0AJL7_9HELO|nr:hypothetical protein OCU04_007853 [Sclerotinia nivalis]